MHEGERESALHLHGVNWSLVGELTATCLLLFKNRFLNLGGLSHTMPNLPFVLLLFATFL